MPRSSAASCSLIPNISQALARPRGNQHKGLVYDVWLHATRDWSGWRRSKVRSLIALLITRKYFGNRVRDAIGLLMQDGFDRRAAQRKLRAFLWGKPGMMRRMFFEWAAILKPGFLP